MPVHQPYTPNGDVLAAEQYIDARCHVRSSASRGTDDLCVTVCDDAAEGGGAYILSAEHCMKARCPVDSSTTCAAEALMKYV